MAGPPGEESRRLCCATLLGAGLLDNWAFVAHWVGLPEANQYFVHGVLQAGGWFVQFARCLGSQLAKLVTISYVGQSAENELGAHESTSLFLK